VAAWLVLLLAVAAGLLFLNIQQYAASHCLTTLAMPRTLHRPPAVTEDWEDLACSSGLCNYMLSAFEPDDESSGAPEPADEPEAAGSGKHQSPPDPLENTDKGQGELLCS